MSIRGEDFGTDLTLAEDDAGIWSPSQTTPVPAPRDLRSLYEQERARADAAEARCEELRRAEMASRSRAGSLKSQLDASRTKLKAAEAEIEEVRRASKSALALQAEVTRLETLLSEAGVESSKRSTVMSLRKEVARLRNEVARLREAAPAPEARPRPASRRSRNPQEKLASLREENARLKKEARAAKRQGSRTRFLEREVEDFRWSLRKSHDHIERLKFHHREEIDWLKKDIAWLRDVVGQSADKHLDEIASLHKKFDRRHAAAARLLETRDRTIAWLRERNERLRAATARATALIASLRERNAQLRAEVRELEAERTALASRVETLEAAVAKARASRTALSKTMFGRKSERQKKPGTGRKRGQQRGAPGHGRTPRPDLREREDKRNPPKDARVCSRCGKPYAPNGEHSTSLIEIAAEAYKRMIVRPRWRRTCECEASPREVTAPPVTRLFDNTPYGISVWSCVLFERYVSCRPLHRVSAWLAAMGLPISPGTLAGSVKRFVPLFEPVAKAILAHQNEAAVRHADETTWRVQAYRKKGRSSRGWLWTSATADALYFHIDPSRSAEVAMMLFGSVKGIVILVCDRLSTYKRLARQLDGKVVLQWCWAHQRRSFIDCAAGHVRLTRWCEGWIERIAEIYRLNDDRLKHYDPALDRQTAEFDAAQAELKKAVDALFADAEAELAGLSAKALRAKPLRSLLNHREGLCVFVDNPQVPMDNNFAERALRGAVIGRQQSFGSDSEKGAEFTAMMYTVTGTLEMNGIDVRRWLQQWLTACAKNGGEPPEDLGPWLPWSMSGKRRRELTAPR